MYEDVLEHGSTPGWDGVAEWQTCASLNITVRREPCMDRPTRITPRDASILDLGQESQADDQNFTAPSGPQVSSPPVASRGGRQQDGAFPPTGCAGQDPAFHAGAWRRR